MPDEDATLSQFVPDEDDAADHADDVDESGDIDDAHDAEEESAADEGGDADGGDPPADGPEVDEVDPAVPTAVVAPDGAACDACGATVRRRWQDDGALVCADCKEW